jgi:hypothetical protein
MPGFALEPVGYASSEVFGPTGDVNFILLPPDHATNVLAMPDQAFFA